MDKRCVGTVRGEPCTRRAERKGQWCPSCYALKWNRENPERRMKIQRAYDQRHLEKERRRKNDWNKAHPEYRRAQRANLTPEQRAKYNETRHRWKEARREDLARYQREWRKANPEKERTNVANCHGRRRAKERASESRLTAREWRAILETSGHFCYYCGDSDVPLEQEHMTPISRGGTHTADNVVPACRPCNRRKRTMTAEEFMELLAAS